MDAQVEEQFMYPEMLAFSELLKRHGRNVELLSPEELHAGQNGVLQAAGMKVDAIYNRHTDFLPSGQEYDPYSQGLLCR